MKYDIKSINRRIRNIKSKDLQPVTLKSKSDYYANIIAKKGASNEGEILSYKEAKKQNKLFGEEITEEEYKEKLTEFIQDLGPQTSVYATYKEAYEIALKGVIPYMKNKDPDLYNRFNSLNMKDKINLLRDFGRELNYQEKQGYQSGDNYIQLLEQWLNEYGV